ncbi:MAG TPA: hypothetical protein ENK02_15150 [Planctomycetes bacterium]|nr:hypothetical protein [Planctomycetota bacterium]
MKFSISAVFTIPASCFLLTTLGFAHGGQYRGPGDIVPPGAGRGGSGGKTGGPGDPSTPGPGGPTIPGPGRSSTGEPPSPPPAPTGNGRRRQAQTGGGGQWITDDLSQWQFWWELNKDRFLHLKRAIRSSGVTSGTDDYVLGRNSQDQAKDTLGPTERDRKYVTEALKRTLNDPDSNRDIVSSCIISLAKIGLDQSILVEIKKHLSSRDQEISETATIAIGIANLVEGVKYLLALAKDTPEGRELLKRNRTPFRTRSFACYGLGLIAYATKDHDLKSKIFEAMKALIQDENLNNRDIKVAAFQAIRLLRPAMGSRMGKELTQSAVAFLSGYIARKKVNKQVQSHAYTALATLVGRGDRYDTQGKLREMVTKAVGDRNRKHWIHQSAVLALGQMGTPEDITLCKTLQKYMIKGKDQQAKNFCAISLGQIGGAANRDFLLSKFRQRRTRTLLKPWIALGLGIMENQRHLRLSNSPAPASSLAREAVLNAFKKEKNRLFASAFAVSLGLMRATEAVDDIVDRMHKYQNTQESCGYMALALGLLNAGEMKSDINEMVDRSFHFEILLTQASIALGLIGDKEIGRKLIAKMKDEKNGLAVQASLAQALGFIGDKRSVRPLVEIMENSNSYKDIPRAFAAVALGLICDKEEYPWNSKISMNINYRANTETLTGSSTGVLDIL